MSCKPMQHCTQLMGDLVRIVETNCKVRDKKHKSQVKWKYPKMAQSHPSVHLEHPDQVMEEDQRTWAVAPKIHPRQSSSCSRPGLKMIKPVHYLLIIWSLSTSCCTSSIHPDGWNEILAFSKKNVKRNITFFNHQKCWSSARDPKIDALLRVGTLRFAAPWAVFGHIEIAGMHNESLKWG